MSTNSRQNAYWCIVVDVHDLNCVRLVSEIHQNSDELITCALIHRSSNGISQIYSSMRASNEVRNVYSAQLQHFERRMRKLPALCIKRIIWCIIEDRNDHHNVYQGVRESEHISAGRINRSRILLVLPPLRRTCWFG